MNLGKPSNANRVVLFPATVLMLLARSIAAFGQAADASPEMSVGSDLSVPSMVSAAFPMVSAIVAFVPLFAPETASTMPWVANPIRLGAHVPLYWIDPCRAIGYSIAGLALPAAGVGFMFAGPSIPVSQPLGASLMGGYFHLMEYAAYDTYRLGSRSRGGYDLLTLAAAPFSSENVFSPLVWVPSIVGPASLVAFYLVFEPDLGVAVYKSGQSHIGSAQVSPALGGLSAAAFGTLDMLAVSVGEESYYRGILYEEAKRSLGTWPARAMDMILFPSIHLPTDILAGLKAETIIFNFGWRSAMTLVFDLAYDAGGLPLSVSTHFWSDLVLIMAQWLFYGG